MKTEDGPHAASSGRLQQRRRFRRTPVPTHGQPFVTGERLRVFDEGTGMYEAVVVGVEWDTAFIEVSSEPLAT